MEPAQKMPRHVHGDDSLQGMESMLVLLLL